jgi:hypothetical protein
MESEVRGGRAAVSQVRINRESLASENGYLQLTEASDENDCDARVDFSGGDVGKCIDSPLKRSSHTAIIRKPLGIEIRVSKRS